jgi:NADH dehydrogenase (ubiquinone) 1 alpha subcomplex subunit 9
MDVAQALANLTSIPQLPATLSLPGPSTLTHEYLLELVSSITYQPPSRAPVLPKAVATVLAKAAQAVWWPALCPDEVARRYMDDVDVPGDWAAFGVEPSEIENHAITYLRRYRSAYVACILFAARCYLTWTGFAILGRTSCGQSCSLLVPLLLLR